MSTVLPVVMPQASTGRRYYRNPYRTTVSKKYLYRLKKQSRTLKRKRYASTKLRNEYIGKRGTMESKSFFGENYASADPQQKLRRQAMSFRGTGGYYSDYVKPFLQRTIPKGTFSSVGEAYGGPIGGWAGGKVANYLGYGDYSTNQLVANDNMTQIAVNSSREQDLWLERTEFVQTVFSTTAFTQQSFVLNPGNDVLWPWLSYISKLYELYNFEGLMFQYKPLVETGTSQVGKVSMCTVYDPYHTQFLTENQMQNYAYAQSDKATNGLIHGTETDDNKVPQAVMFIKHTDDTQSRPKEMTDLGVFVLGTNNPNISSGTVLGELWVTYKICLKRPQSIPAAGTISESLLVHSRDTISNPPVSILTTPAWSFESDLASRDITFSSVGGTVVTVAVRNINIPTNSTTYWELDYYLYAYTAGAANVKCTALSFLAEPLDFAGNTDLNRGSYQQKNGRQLLVQSTDITTPSFDNKQNVHLLGTLVENGRSTIIRATNYFRLASNSNAGGWRLIMQLIKDGFGVGTKGAILTARVRNISEQFYNSLDGKL
jgi:hypothetical protein